MIYVESLESSVSISSVHDKCPWTSKVCVIKLRRSTFFSALLCLLSLYRQSSSRATKNDSFEGVFLKELSCHLWRLEETGIKPFLVLFSFIFSSSAAEEKIYVGNITGTKDRKCWSVLLCMCFFSRLSSVVKAGEATAEEGEDALQGPLRVRPR